MTRAVKIDVTRQYVSDGMVARNEGKAFTDCPHNSFTETGRIAKAHWLYGWRLRDDALKKELKRPRDATGRGIWVDK